MNISEELVWESWMDELATNDYVVIDDFLKERPLSLLIAFFDKKIQQNQFSKAAIGSTGNELLIREIRGDYTYWLDQKMDVSLQSIFEILEETKSILNRMCYLSLSHFEFHLAHYPIGSFYKKHLDQFNHRNNRMISMIIYLNEDWNQGDGGELKVYPKNKKPESISPLMNRCVLFKSDALLHEVLETNVGRKSLTGWMLYQPTPLTVIQ